MKAILKRIDLFFVVIFLMFLAIYCYKYYLILTYPYVGEYREGTPLIITQLLLDYVNPFSIEALPLAHTLYGVLYNLVVLPFAQLFGSTLIVHRLVSAVFLWASVLLIFNINRQNGCKVSTNLGISLLFYASCFVVGPNFATILGQPGSLGLFLMLLSVYIPLKYNFNLPSLFTSAALAVLCFLTKEYFSVGFMLVATYTFLFVSKSRALIYGIVFISLLAFAAVVVEHIFPLYFAETFYLALVHYADAHKGLSFFLPTEVVISQFKFFIKYYSPLLLVLGCVLYFRERVVPSIKEKKIRRFLGSLDWRPSQPLVAMTCDFYFFSIIATLIVFYLELGKNSGAWIEYLVQLTLPFMILYIGKQEYSLDQAKRFLINVLIVMNVIWLFNISFVHSLKNTLNEWKYVDSLIQNHHNIFASPAVTTLLLKHDKKVYVSGQSAYAFYIPGEFEVKKSRILVPQAAAVNLSKKLDKFQKDVINQIQQNKFDLCIMDDQDMMFFEEALKELKKRYVLVKKFPLDMPISNQDWNMSVYMPRTKGSIKV